MSKITSTLPPAHGGDARPVQRPRLRLAALMAGGMLALMGAGAPADAVAQPAGKTAEVHIDNFAFTPAVLVIAPGTTVTWTNRDDIPHTVTEKAVAFKSKVLDTDEQFTKTFDTPGEVDYFCSLHPHMTGKIVIKP